MCGIFGYVGDVSLNIGPPTEIIRHRGPDAVGYLHCFLEDGDIYENVSQVERDGWRVSFGFRRLSIIDLSEKANQPFSNKEKGYHIIFNGEIYNYVELRNELQQLGHHFKTKSDTEVLLTAYIQWGTNCFERLNGMWAVCILDLANQKLVCSRDRFGIKPLFYYFNKRDQSFFVASELKQFFVAGVPKKLNEHLIRDFIDKNIIDHTTSTFYQNIFHLPAGNYIEYDLSAKQLGLTFRYWDLRVQNDYQGLDFAESKKRFRDLFLDSIKLRFRSDVPVGSCLSGGLDSSSIVSTAASIFDFPIHTFTSRFDIAKYDESTYVRHLASVFKNIDSHFCQLTEKTFEQEIDQVIFYQDEPFGAMSILAQWEVMKLAKTYKVPVLLDGQGGDEQLAGYRKFYAFYLKEKLANQHYGKFFNASYYLIKNREFNFFDIQQIKRYLGVSPNLNFYSDLGVNLPNQANIGLGTAKTMRERSKLDIEKFSFPPLLRFEDRNSMAFSIETRVPFMDYRLVEFLYSISADHKIRNGYTKAILRESLEGILPDKIRKRISKLGFATPQEVWMATSLKPYFRNYFSKMDNPYFQKEVILRDFEKFPKVNKLSASQFWRIFCFDKWYKLNF